GGDPRRAAPTRAWAHPDRHRAPPVDGAKPRPHRRDAIGPRGAGRVARPAHAARGPLSRADRAGDHPPVAPARRRLSAPGTKVPPPAFSQMRGGPRNHARNSRMNLRNLSFPQLPLPSVQPVAHARKFRGGGAARTDSMVIETDIAPRLDRLPWDRFHT